MLNIDVNLNVKINKPKCPIRFTNNTCVQCAKEGCLVIVDKFGREVKSSTDIHPFDHIKCKNCGSIYSILWQRSEEEDGKLIPTACDSSFKHEINNLLDYPIIKHNGINEIQ